MGEEEDDEDGESAWTRRVDKDGVTAGGTAPRPEGYWRAGAQDRDSWRRLIEVSQQPAVNIPRTTAYVLRGTVFSHTKHSSSPAQVSSDIILAGECRHM